MPRRWSACWPCWNRRNRLFGLGAATRIYLAVGRTDMRKGFNGLFGLVRDRLQCEPLSGHVFFVLQWTAQSAEVGVLGWQWVVGVREEIGEGKFRWPEVNGDQNKVQLSHEELALLLGGIGSAAGETAAVVPTGSR